VQTILRTAEVCIYKPLQRANHFADAQTADPGTVQTIVQTPQFVKLHTILQTPELCKPANSWIFE
jgi:hypothetical protein